MALFVKVADAEGIYDVNVKLTQVSTGNVIIDAAGIMQITSRLSAMGFILPLQNVPLPAEGLYEFQIWANNAYIGSATLEAAKIGSEAT
jgi:hypothetical protein